MSTKTHPIIDQYGTDGSISTSTAANFYTTGDVASRNVWADGLNAYLDKAEYALKATANGELLIGHAANQNYKKAVPTGSNGITVTTGAGTLAFGLSAAARANYATATAKLDLSASAQSDVVIFHATRACTLVSARLLYTEASSSDAGVTVTIGKETDAAYYYTGTSEISKAKWSELDVTLLATDIAAGDTVICGTAGSKVGTGEILVCIEFTTV